MFRVNDRVADRILDVQPRGLGFRWLGLWFAGTPPKDRVCFDGLGLSGFGFGLG